jgi:ribosomal protein S18 acetylase RimI-like enzyme
MDVRVYRADDHKAVVALWNDVFPDNAPWNDPADNIAVKLTTQPQLFLVAEDGDEIVGTVMAGFDGHRGWVHYVAVSPRHRRRGIGTALMRAAEERLVEMYCLKLNLQVRGGNSGAVRFYEGLGYAIEDRVSMGKLLRGRKGR